MRLALRLLPIALCLLWHQPSLAQTTYAIQHTAYVHAVEQGLM